MANIPFKDLYDEFIKIAERGDEQEARDFLIKHLNDFPEKVRKGLVLAFFEDAVATQAEDAALVSDFQNESVQALNDMTTLKKTLEDKGKLLEVKDSI